MLAGAWCVGLGAEIFGWVILQFRISVQDTVIKSQGHRSWVCSGDKFVPFKFRAPSCQARQYVRAFEAKKLAEERCVRFNLATQPQIRA